MFQPLISGIKSLHVSSSQLCSHLNGVWLLQGINHRRWLNFTSKSSVKTGRISGRGQWSKPQLYSCEPQGQESTFKVLYLLSKGTKRDLEGLKILACSLMPTGSTFSSVLDHWLRCRWSQEQRPSHPLSGVAWWPENYFIWLSIFREKIFQHFITLLSPASEIWSCSIHEHMQTYVMEENENKL